MKSEKELVICRAFKDGKCSGRTCAESESSFNRHHEPHEHDGEACEKENCVYAKGYNTLCVPVKVRYPSDDYNDIDGEMFI